MSLALSEGSIPQTITVHAAGKKRAIKHQQEGARLEISFAEEAHVQAGEKLQVEIVLADS